MVFPLGSLGRGLELAGVPRVPEFNEPVNKWPGEMIDQPMMQAQPKGSVANAAQWDVIARYIDTAKAIDLLEFSQGVRFLIAIGKVLVHKIWDASFSAGTHRLCN